MNRFWIYIFGFAFISCSKSDNTLKCETCFANMYINGISWQADILDASTLDNGYLSVSFSSNDSFDQGRESLSFSKIIPEVAMYKLSSGPKTLLETGEVSIFFNTHLSDGDVLGAVYDLVEEEPNELKIQYIDLKGKIVEGTFIMTLVKDSDPGPEFNFPDTVRITQGLFRSDIRTE